MLTAAAATVLAALITTATTIASGVAQNKAGQRTAEEAELKGEAIYDRQLAEKRRAEGEIAREAREQRRYRTEQDILRLRQSQKQNRLSADAINQTKLDILGNKLVDMANSNLGFKKALLSF